MKISRRTAVGALAGSAALAACSSGGGGAGGGGGGDGEVPANLPPLTIHANSANTYQANFNPFSAVALPGTRGFLYEPLIVRTPMRPGEAQPWLAESIEFNDDGTVITVTTREGVTWSDGEAFDAEDVAFTFTMAIEHPETNLGARPIVEAKAVDERTAEVTFEEPQFAFEAAIGNTLILPEHIWSSIEDPADAANEEPVATGPFVLDRMEAQIYTLRKNEDYWQADQIQVQEIHYPANTTETFNVALANGDLDWAGGFVPNIDKLYVDADPEHRGYWYPGDGLVTLLYNAQKEIFDDTVLREAISLGIDRQQLSDVAMQGYSPPAHPTGLPLPAYESVIADDYQDATLEHDPERANQLLDEAGYEKGADGIRTSPSGDRLSWNVEIPSSWADWVDIMQLISEHLAEIGIDVSPQGIAFESWVETRNTGSFDLTLSTVAIGQTPFDMYRSIMSSEYKVDEGPVTQNFARYYNDDADEELAAYGSTLDEATRKEAIDGLQRIMVEERPMIPLVQSANWFQRTTERWEGFPNEKDPYAFGAPYQSPDNVLVVMNLTPAQS